DRPEDGAQEDPDRGPEGERHGRDRGEGAREDASEYRSDEITDDPSHTAGDGTTDLPVLARSGQGVLQPLPALRAALQSRPEGLRALALPSPHELAELAFEPALPLLDLVFLGIQSRRGDRDALRVPVQQVERHAERGDVLDEPADPGREHRAERVEHETER